VIGSCCSPQLCWHGSFQQRGLDGPKKPVALSFAKAGRIDQQDDIGWRGGTFGLESGQDACIVGVDAIDPYAGGPCEIGVQLLVRLIVACRIQVELWRLCQGQRAHACGCERHGLAF